MDINAERARFNKELADFKRDYKNQKAAHESSISSSKVEFEKGGKEKQYDEEMTYYAKAVEDTIAEGIEYVVENQKS